MHRHIPVIGTKEVAKAAEPRIERFAAKLVAPFVAFNRSTVSSRPDPPIGQIPSEEGCISTFVDEAFDGVSLTRRPVFIVTNGEYEPVWIERNCARVEI